MNPESVRKPTVKTAVTTCTPRGSSMPTRLTAITDRNRTTITASVGTVGKTARATCAKTKLSTPATSTTEIR